MAQPGKLVDASFVDGPRPRNPREETATIKSGATPAEGAEQPAKHRQKDVAARWTKQNNERPDGDQNRVKAEAPRKLSETYAVTAAGGHDSQRLEPLVATGAGAVSADSA